jgi:Fe-S-cluster containining protein
MESLAIVSCDRCGACCMQQGHPPYTDDELQFVPDELLESINGHLSQLEADDFGEPCIWLDSDTKQCRNYEHRPQVCRDFERGCDSCVELRLRFLEEEHVRERGLGERRAHAGKSRGAAPGDVE